MYQGSAYLEHALRNIDSGRYQVLCASCNQIKLTTHLENGKRFDLDAAPDLSTTLLDPELLP